MGRSVDQATHMAGLVDNALNFLDQAFNELRASPKYSVIHFYAAVELFLKARLLRDSLAHEASREAVGVNKVPHRKAGVQTGTGR